MSVQADGTGDFLTYVNGDNFAPGTGDFNIGFWLYINTDEDSVNDVFLIGGTIGSGPVLGVYTTSSGTNLELAHPDFTNIASATSLSTATWYYVVGSRGGTTARLRIFDDTTSTTPINGANGETSTGFTTNITTYDSMRVGEWWAGDTTLPAEWEKLSIDVGTEWTNAQCRTESQSYDYTQAGTEWGTWELTNVDADANGINDTSGNARNFTNSGMVAGSNGPPSQLTASATILLQMMMQGAV